MFRVVVLSYNHPQITSRCVKSVLALVNSEQVSILHNGSEAKFVEQLRAEWPQIQHWVHTDNRGYSGGANRALSQAFGDASWVLFLTNDTELVALKPDLEALRPGIYSPRTFLRRLDRIDYTMGFFDSRRGRLWHAKVPHVGAQSRQGVYPYIPGTAFLLDRATFEFMGPFDESCHTYWEDVDYGARAAKAGIFMSTHVGVEVLHAGGKTNRKNPFYTRVLFQRNRRRISWRHCPWWAKPVLAMRFALDQLPVRHAKPREL